MLFWKPEIPSFNTIWRCLNGYVAPDGSSTVMCWKGWVLKSGRSDVSDPEMSPSMASLIYSAVYYSGINFEGSACLWPPVPLHPLVCDSFDKTEPVKSEHWSHSPCHCKNTVAAKDNIKSSKKKATLLIGFATRTASNTYVLHGSTIKEEIYTVESDPLHCSYSHCVNPFLPWFSALLSSTLNDLHLMPTFSAKTESTVSGSKGVYVCVCGGVR